MGIIPLEKLIEYKGNRYELSKAMIELAKNGGTLLKGETKYRGGKYIPTVMKNILDGKIKYEYEEGVDMIVDEEAPFKHSEAAYDESEYASEDDSSEEENDSEYAASDSDDADDDYDDDYSEDEEKSKKKKKSSKKKDE
ncbi:DNA-directed RNA polymerase subunit omega [Brachyspira hampsonii]|uniref:DNA-directed RNA polymerase subunit omega n=1 Tax=Brachyspira hampsonii 30446 TaxID=1289135 RepID=A0A2U4FB84_9SPIR|nr:hypothetical protein [Brachyspira hampsonii]EKV56644.1 hypothetical protein A966_08859 [Brachyspira hampsonii 30446]MBW5389175.1 hypothetical protein [Brachyspira hampsonii]MBW5393798.1 hypothetical protein [Brachyspira hampsonii]OEJ17323.1 hypothetical protein A9495_07525 [Brachyspira hampsonii]